MNLEILKLGGSVVTNKNQPMSPNTVAINRIAREIFTAGGRGLVIVHGGGSYGHPLAKEYEISNGYHSDLQLAGFSKTRQAMIQLNSIIVNALLDAHVPAVSVNPSSFIVTNNKNIEEIDFKIVELYIKAGMVPVLYGDAVLDTEIKFTILSGDQLAARLAIDLKVQRLIYGVDVDGVYTANPKLTSNARLIEDLSLSHMKGIVKIGEALSTDVTGGMLGKVQEAAFAVESGVNVLILNALKSDYIYNALLGESVVCTKLRR
ncbi:MAG: isopentenyl phosphate kinase [Candidatus Bathyarchaeota archaeon]|nr:isopentenyl phosphate kinase [Candidatus Bathyarchaeota archaeon]